MTPVSRRLLSGEAQRKIKDVFITELTGISNKRSMESLISVLLTDSEKFMLAKRLVAFVMIDNGLSDVEIARTLHITRATSNRFRIVYRFAQEKRDPVVNQVQKLKLNPQLKQLFKDFLLKYALPAAFGKIPKW